MKTRYLAISAIVLWGITLLVGVFFFLKGNTLPGPDQRIAVVLNEGERDFVLSEMRGMLSHIQLVVDSLSKDDLETLSTIAGELGTADMSAMPPGMLAKVPISFKQMGMRVHQEFASLAEMPDEGASPQQMLGQVSNILSVCVSCHATYRFAIETNTGETP